MKAAWIVDWRQTTNAERRCLFAALDRIRRAREIDWPDVWREAFGPDHGLGDGYEENCRKGAMGRPRAARLFEWVLTYNRAEAEAAEDAVLRLRLDETDDAERQIRWEDYIRRVGIFSNIDLLPAPDEPRSLIALTRAEPRELGTVRLGERFRFKLHCSRSGFLAILMSYRHHWYLLEPAERMSFVSIPAPGTIIVPPPEGQGFGDALCEETDPGKHRFVFVFAPGRNFLAILDGRVPGISIADCDLDELAKTLSSLAENVLIYRCSIIVTS